MHNIKKAFLIIPICLFVACKKDEILAPQKEEKEIFQFEYVTKDGDLDLSEFTYSMPDDYFHLTIKEIVYEYDKEVTEKIILEQDLEKTSGVIQIQKESITSENTRLNFNVPISLEKSFVSSSDFPIPSDYFNLFGANTTKVNDPKINLYVYKGKKPEDAKGSIQLTNQVFNDNYDISDSLEKNEVIIIWSCEFTKE